jgi:hypothetical protein
MLKKRHINYKKNVCRRAHGRPAPLTHHNGSQHQAEDTTGAPHPGAPRRRRAIEILTAARGFHKKLSAIDKK